MAALAKMQKQQQQQQQGAGSAAGNGSGATEQQTAGAAPGTGGATGTGAGCAADGRKSTAAAGMSDEGHRQGTGEAEAEEQEKEQAHAEAVAELSRIVAESQNEEAAWAAGAGPSGVLAPRVVVLLAQQAVGTLVQCGGVAVGEVMCLARELRPGLREALTARSLSPACNALADRGLLERRKEPQMSLRWVLRVQSRYERKICWSSVLAGVWGCWSWGRSHDLAQVGGSLKGSGGRYACGLLRSVSSISMKSVGPCHC